jgi:predicted dinucleotide-binding enzyme
MSQPVRTVAIIGCGVIGMSWATLFLANGLKVIISDPLEGAEVAFRKYVHDAWPVLNAKKGVEETLAEQYEFVVDINPRLAEVDFIQEVLESASHSHGYQVRTATNQNIRTDQSALTSSKSCSLRLTVMPDPVS